MKRAFVVSACMLPACAMAWGQEAEYESFEDGVPAYFAATRAESLSLSPWHSKQGKNSLRWDWSAGEELVIRHGIGDVARLGGLQQQQGQLRRVGVHGRADLRCAGLRVPRRRGSHRLLPVPAGVHRLAAGASFLHGFPSGKPTAKVDNIRIAAPSKAAKGTVFLDFIKYNTLTYSAAVRSSLRKRRSGGALCRTSGASPSPSA